MEVLISQCVLERLLHLRRRARPGSSRSSINRVTARYLNSFEPDRIQSRPFFGVQNIETMEKYSMLWSQLIFFLLRVQEHQEAYLDNYLIRADQDGELQRLLQEMQDAGQTLHSNNPQGLSFTNCLHNQIGQAADSANLRRCAKALRSVVEQLSMALVRQEHHENPFSSYVIAYSATWTLNNHGAWLSAGDYRPFLSGIIHCMQLWLLGYCLQQYQHQVPKSTLQDFVLSQCQSHLVNTTNSPIAELSYWRLLCRAARSDNPKPPVTTITDDCLQVNHADIELRLPAWRHALRTLLYEAAELLNTSLLFGLQGLADYPVESLQDNMAELRPGLSFVDDPRNRLHAVKDNVVHQLLQRPELRQRFFKEQMLSPSDAGLRAEPSQTAGLHLVQLDIYLHANQRFLQLLGVLIVMTAGLPPRRKELLGVSWCNQETPRNIFVYDRLLAVITFYHKAQWRVGSRPVARFLPPYLGNILVRYLIYVPPILRFFYYCMQTPCPRGSLFSAGEDVWRPNRLSAAMKLHTKRVLGFPIRYRQWRHMAIALDRRLLQGVGCQVYHIVADLGGDREDTSDSNLEPSAHPSSHPPPISSGTAGSAHHWQAAHTTATNVSHYGNSSAPFGLLTDTLLAEYCNVSRQFHQLAHVQTVEGVACNRKRPGSLSTEPSCREKKPLLGSRRYIRQQLWTWPAIEQSLKDLFGPTATARDRMQRDALRLLAGQTPESIIILPTGGGKSTLYLVLSRLSAAEVTIVVVPFIALRQDLVRRCHEHGLAYWHYNSVDRMQDRLHAVPALVFVDVDTAVTSPFLAFLKQLHDLGRVDRLILDEAHLVLTASSYRENLGRLGMLRQVPCPFVCLTATLPPHGELDLAQSLLLSHPTVQRASSDRPNLEYCVRSLGAPDPPASSAPPASGEDRLTHAVIQLCQREMRQWQAGGTLGGPTARGLCFVRQRAMGSSLAQHLDCDFYHAQLPTAERASILTAWSQGQRSPFLIATSALGAGVDYPAVRCVIHVDAPDGLVAYGQETGRAGRDGLHAVCTIVLPPKWSVSWDRRYRNDFIAEDIKGMTGFLQTRHCLRRLLTGYLDGSLGGREGTACKEADGIERVRCCNCQLATAQLGTGPAYLEAQHRQPDPRPRIALDPRTSPGTSPGTSPASARSQVGGRVQRESATESSDKATHPMDAGSESESEASSLASSASSASASGTSSPQQTVPSEVLQAAALLSRLGSMEAATAQALYEQRLAAWRRACILCSFQHRRPTSFPHPDCLQAHQHPSLTAFRRGVTFERGVGCFRCGQPGFVCQQRGRPGCRYPWFVFHCCWVALTQDTTHALEVIRTLGGPDLSHAASSHAVEQHPDYLHWIGRRGLVFGHVPAANAMRLASVWIDRLETLSQSAG